MGIIADSLRSQINEMKDQDEKLLRRIDSMILDLKEYNNRLGEIIKEELDS